MQLFLLSLRQWDLLPSFEGPPRRLRLNLPAVESIARIHDIDLNPWTFGGLQILENAYIEVTSKSGKPGSTDSPHERGRHRTRH